MPTARVPVPLDLAPVNDLAEAGRRVWAIRVLAQSALPLRMPDRQLSTRLGKWWEVEEDAEVVGRAVARMPSDHRLARRDLAPFRKTEQNRLPTGSLGTSEMTDLGPVDVHRDRVFVVRILGLRNEVRATEKPDVLATTSAARAQERRLVVRFANRADNVVTLEEQFDEGCPRC